MSWLKRADRPKQPREDRTIYIGQKSPKGVVRPPLIREQGVTPPPATHVRPDDCPHCGTRLN